MVIAFFAMVFAPFAVLAFQLIATVRQADEPKATGASSSGYLCVSVSLWFNSMGK